MIEFLSSDERFIRVKLVIRSIYFGWSFLGQLLGMIFLSYVVFQIPLYMLNEKLEKNEFSNGSFQIIAFLLLCPIFYFIHFVESRERQMFLDGFEFESISMSEFEGT